MLKAPNTDLWTIAIVEAPIARALRADFLTAHRIVFGPKLAPFTFLADPFGIWRDGTLHVFAEFFDYRDKIGRIDVLRYDRALRLIDHAPALSAPFHLSYPQLIEADGELFMLPEAHRSGKLTAYRAQAFPHRWERAFDLLDLPAIDATPFQVGDGWRMLFTQPGAGAMRQTWMAQAPRFAGPWTVRPQPVHDDLATGRPGGTAFAQDAQIYVPMQDCRATYGGAVEIVALAAVGDTWAQAGRVQSGAWADPWRDGLHTLSAAGPVTLIDLKQSLISRRRWLVDWERRRRRLMGRTGRRGG